jgi:HAD superfamily hydrolase (TIGR01509 family)
MNPSVQSNYVPSSRATIKAVAFDLDGLMFNTEYVFHLSGTELLRRRGKQWTTAIQASMMGRRAVEAYPLLIQLAELSDSFEDLRKESREIFHGLLPEHIAPMPGLFDLLDRLESQGLPKGVATSSSRNYLEGILKQFDIIDRFAMTLTADDVTQGKPHPEIYLTAAEKLGVAPSELLVFEDSGAGTAAGVAAGATVISVPHEYSCTHCFDGAACIAKGLDDPRILAILNGE